MNKLREFETKRFPLNTITEVVDLVKDVLGSREEPNIAFMSILLGVIEHSMTVFNCNENKLKGRSVKKPSAINLQDNSTKHINEENKEHDAIPTLSLGTVELFYEKFYTLMSSNIDMKFYHLVDNFSPSGLVKRISDVVWDALTRTFYKDKNHLSSLYTMFTEKKMDCFGMSIGVLAGCQLLGLTDVNLVLTEDHSWAIFGPKKKINMEITWHGKGTEDKRGFSVEATAPENSWVYASPMVCDKWMEFASLVVSMNPVIHSSLESSEIASLQKQILMLLYDAGHLKRYPMALDCLADLEEIFPTSNRPKSLDLYNEALAISRRHYDDHLIFPHTYLANYYYRRRVYKRALYCWANAAEVAGRYNYNREDDEMHREFYDIANDIIPNIIRTTSLKLSTENSNPKPKVAYSGSTTDPKLNSSSANHRPLLEDPWCFIDLLRFFDGMCRWEEGSSMPVFHIIWANSMTFCLTKFPFAIRSGVWLSDVETEELKSSRLSKLDVGRSKDNLSEEKVVGGSVDEEESLKINSDTKIDSGDNKNNSTDRIVKNIEENDRKKPDKRDKLSNSNPPDGPTVDSCLDKKQDPESGERTGRAFLLLRSEKMSAIKDLFVAERINTSAIKLQMTAQSQVATKTKLLVEKVDEDGKKSDGCGGRKRVSDEGRNGSKHLEGEKGQLNKRRKVTL